MLDRIDLALHRAHEGHRAVGHLCHELLILHHGGDGPLVWNHQLGTLQKVLLFFSGSDVINKF